MNLPRNSQNRLNGTLGTQKPNYKDYGKNNAHNGITRKNEIKNEQKGPYQAPIKKFQKSQFKNSYKIDCNINQIIENRSNDFLFNNEDKKRSPITIHRYNEENKTNNLPKKYEGNNILKNENIKYKFNQNHFIGMTTKNNYNKNIQQNRIMEKLIDIMIKNI